MTATTQDIVYHCPLSVVQEATRMAKDIAIRTEPNYHHWNSPHPEWYSKSAKKTVQEGFLMGRSHTVLAKKLLDDGQGGLLARAFRAPEGGGLAPVYLLGIRAGIAEGQFPFGSQTRLSTRAKEILEQAGYTVTQVPTQSD